jgi:long-chain acyl-CoA synthetase
VADGASRDAILESVSRRLTPFKVPRELHFLAELPKGRTGKVLLPELVNQLTAASAPTGGADGVAIEELILDLAAKAFRRPRGELKLSTAPTTCPGWDSMAHLDFVCGLERALGVRFEPREVMRMQSLQATLDLARRATAR